VFPSRASRGDDTEQAHASLNAANQALARTTRGPKAANERSPDSPNDIAKSPIPTTPGPPGFRFLVERCQVLVIEDLNVAGMVRNRRLAKSVSDAAMGELSRQFLYKARWHGVEVGSPTDSFRAPRRVPVAARSKRTRPVDADLLM